MAKQDIKYAPIELTLEVIGGKWKPLIIYFLSKNQVMRFNEIKRTIPSASRRMLTKHLRDLEAHGIVHREVYAEVPPRVEYSLTELGYTLIPVLDTLLEWGLGYIQDHPEITLRTPNDLQIEN